MKRAKLTGTRESGCVSPPAWSSSTWWRPFAVRRLASAAPAEPAPTMTKSAVRWFISTPFRFLAIATYHPADARRDRGKQIMHVQINGVRLFFDVEGAKLVPDGATMREKPTLLLLHGGPGFDHTIYKPAYSALADVAQLIYLDHRGNGRSDPGPKESWTLAQWA